jgi:HSP20 family protein
MAMAIIRWYERPDPRGLSDQVERMQREMNRVFTDFFGRGASPLRAGVFPPVNVTEDQENLYIRAELPGIKPEEMEISVEGETLTLRGERKLHTAENVSYHRREREAGRFRRILTLPARINPEGVNAIFKNGVLNVVLPKAEEARPKQIRIKSQ